MGKWASPAALGPWMDDEGQGPNGNCSLTLEGLPQDKKELTNSISSSLEREMSFRLSKSYSFHKSLQSRQDPDRLVSGETQTLEPWEPRKRH